MSNPLNLVTDPEIKQMRIESLTVFPRTINDNETGGQVHFVLPNKGYLSSDSRIVLPAKCADPAYQYPPNVGVFSLASTATLSTESRGVLCQLDNAGELYANMNLLTPPEKKRSIDSVLHGINYVCETASSSKCDGVLANVECMPGMFRLCCSSLDCCTNVALDEIFVLSLQLKLRRNETVRPSASTRGAVALQYPQSQHVSRTCVLCGMVWCDNGVLRKNRMGQEIRIYYHKHHDFSPSCGFDIDQL